MSVCLSVLCERKLRVNIHDGSVSLCGDEAFLLNPALSSSPFLCSVHAAGCWYFLRGLKPLFDSQVSAEVLVFQLCGGGGGGGGGPF